MRRHVHRLRPLACCLVALATTAVPGQEQPAATFEDWKKLDASPELTAYRNQLRENVFGDAERTFVTKSALPQLGNPKNRPEIDRIRRKMFDRLCVVDQGTGDGRAPVAAMQTVADVMTAAARDARNDPVHRVNAMLLVGELRGPGATPWAPAVAPLAAALGDESLPPAIRIAAAAGLARHVDASPEARAADVGPMLLKITSAAPAGIDPVAADWLRSRALAMLARMGSAAPAGTAAAASTVLRDPAMSVDARVRAAATLGGCIRAATDTDVAAAIAAIRDVAAVALAATRAGTEQIELGARMGRGDAGQPRQPQPSGPGEPEAAGMTQHYRRDAWRLATLADALATTSGDGGLARFAGPAADAAERLADLLRGAATRLDEEPGPEALEAAIESLAMTATPASAGDSRDGRPEDQPEPAADATGGDGIPFGER